MARETLVAEEGRIGGACVIRGCVPKKLYVHASRFADDFRDAAGFGWTVGEPTFDWPTLVKAKDKEISRLSDAYRENLARSGAKLVEQRATVVDPHRVRFADGREISARHILIASGSRPVTPTGIEGIEHAITSNEVFDLPVFPRRLLVVGRRLYRGRVRFAVPAPWARRSRWSCAGRTSCAASTRTCARACATRWSNAGIVFRFGCLPTSIEKNPDGVVARDAVRRLRHRSRSGADRDRPQPQHQRPWPRSGRSSSSAPSMGR